VSESGFAETLRLERVRLRIAQGTLAARLGVAQQTLCAWEAGRRAPTEHNAASWAAALGVEIPAAVLVALRPKVAACGTPSGYQRHRRRNEKYCEACRAANTASMRRYRAVVSGV